MRDEKLEIFLTANYMKIVIFNTISTTKMHEVNVKMQSAKKTKQFTLLKQSLTPIIIISFDVSPPKCNHKYEYVAIVYYYSFSILLNYDKHTKSTQNIA